MGGCVSVFCLWSEVIDGKVKDRGRHDGYIYTHTLHIFNKIKLLKSLIKYDININN